MNNAHSYVPNIHSTSIFDSDEEEQWEFRGNKIIRNQKSMSATANKSKADLKPMKKSNSFLGSNQQKKKSANKPNKKNPVNMSEVQKKAPSKSKSYLNKTALSISSTSKTVTVKKRSTSRDFLILGDSIYHCDNIQEINEKIAFGDSSIFGHQRFCKATMKKLDRLQCYLKTFCQVRDYQKKSTLPVAKIQPVQKMKLYNLLKTSTRVANSKNKFEQLVRFAAKKLEKDSDNLKAKKPELGPTINCWKNEKLHQLLTAHTLLIDGDSLESFQAEEAEEDELMNPESSGRSSDKPEYHSSCIRHLVNENFPLAKIEQTYSLSDRHHSLLAEDHALSNYGVQLFLQRLWDFIVEQNISQKLINNLREPYGLKSEQKCEVLKNGLPPISYRYAVGFNILDNDLFVEYCRYSRADRPPQEEDKYSIILHKAVFDCANQLLTQYQLQYPKGKLHPFEGQNSLSAFIIDQTNIFDVWGEMIQKVAKNAAEQLGPNHKPQFKDEKIAEFEAEDSFTYLTHRWVLEDVVSLVEVAVIEQFVCEARPFL